MTDNLGWWFAAEPRLPHGDGRPVIIGETHTLSVPPPIVPCKRGFHDCPKAFGALQLAPGPLLYRIRRGGRVVPDGAKFASSERTYLAMADATQMLRDFVRSQALGVIHLWDAPAVVRQYLETGDANLLGLAREAAWDAARNAVRNLERNPAEAAAWAAAWATAEVEAEARNAARNGAWAARNGAWAAVRSAVWDAARDAALVAASTDFERRCLALIGEAD